MSAIIVLFSVILIIVILVNYFPNATEKWFKRVLRVRRIGLATGLIIISILFLATGVIFLQIIGGVALGYAFLTILFDPQLSDVRKTLAGLPVIGVMFRP